MQQDIEAGPHMFQRVQPEPHEEPSAVHMLGAMAAGSQGRIGVGKAVQALPAEESVQPAGDRRGRAARVVELSKRA